MNKIKNFFAKIPVVQKVNYSAFILGIILMLLIIIPTLARILNSNSPDFPEPWDGSVALSYDSGTGVESDPYVIADAAQLAYFAQQLHITNYENTYFVLSSNIIINDGIFDYDTTNGIMYITEEDTFYIKSFTDEYYDNIARSGSPTDIINIFTALDNFKGYFDGNQYTIYGLYMTDSSAYELGLFTNLQGSIQNLQLANIMIYGGTVTGGLASSASGAVVNNVLVDGFVVGTGVKQNLSQAFNPPNMTFIVTSSAVTQYIDVLGSLPFIGGQVTGSTISGHFNPDQGPANKMEATVNGVIIPTGNKPDDFGVPTPIQTGSNITNVPVVASLGGNSGQFTLSELVFTVTWDYAATGGLIGHANDVDIVYAINKTSVYGALTSGGLVGTSTGSLALTSSYNNGIIRGAYSGGGLVGIIEKSTGVSVTNSYSTGSISPIKPNTYSGGLIGYMFNNNGNINLSSVFNTANNFTLGTIKYSDVFISDGYYVYDTPVGDGVVNGAFTKMTDTQLQAKEILESMGFEEFISEEDMEENPTHCWVYKDNEFPLLYSDNKVKPAVNIYVGNNIYNTYKDILDIDAVNNISFLVEESNLFHPVKEKYYYIVESETNYLSLQDLELLDDVNDWQPVLGTEQILVEGYYVIYVKAVDYNNNVTYINTDRLLLDTTPPIASASLGVNVWNSLRSVLNQISLTTNEVITVSASDTSSGIKSISYYFFDSILNSGDLDSLNEVLWEEYDTEIPLINGTYIVYIRVVDNAGNITYINTDILDYSAYEYNGLTLGSKDLYGYSDVYISASSQISFNTTYTSITSIGMGSYTHNLISTIILPFGTKITLIDYEKNKVYTLEITTSNDYGYNTSCNPLDLDCISVATIPFTLFKEVGTDTTKLFVESNYTNAGVVKENFTVILDFSATSMSTDYEDILAYIELQDSLGACVRPTLSGNVTPFSIYYNNTDALVVFSTDYNDDIYLYADAINNININSGINNVELLGIPVQDTTFDDKYLGIAIKLVDEYDNIIAKEYLRYTVFKINSEIYTPGSDGIIRVPLSSLEETNYVLSITTNDIDSGLSAGVYSLVVSNYLSYDGLFGEYLGSEFSIPVIVGTSSGVATEVDFTVNMSEVDQIISKKFRNVPVNFTIYLKETLSSPNIRVTLMEKSELSAYNNNYDAVDLQSYVSDSLTAYAGYIYYVSNNPGSTTTFALNFSTASLDYTGYKLVFDLYDGGKKLSSVTKYFIVK